VTFSQKSDVKKHLAQGLRKTHYLTPTNPDPPAEKADQESAGNDGIVTMPGDKEAVPVKLP
jgi:hypothetical protein